MDERRIIAHRWVHTGRAAWPGSSGQGEVAPTSDRQQRPKGGSGAPRQVHGMPPLCSSQRLACCPLTVPSCRQPLQGILRDRPPKLPSQPGGGRARGRGGHGGDARRQQPSRRLRHSHHRGRSLPAGCRLVRSLGFWPGHAWPCHAAPRIPPTLPLASLIWHRRQAPLAASPAGGCALELPTTLVRVCPRS
jgi:hypothetical protein